MPKNILSSLLCWMLFNSLYAQVPKCGLLQQGDTLINKGQTVQLSMFNITDYDNFLFAAKNTVTKRLTIWKKNIASGIYVPLFNDKYHRSKVVVSADKTEMIYVRHLPQPPGAMYTSTLEAAWVCRSAIDGSGEHVLFMVPQYKRNAIYDLDWTADKTKVLYSLGNDAYPNLTRDGDVFEYTISSGETENKTNDWDHWQQFCRYTPDGKTIVYTRCETGWYAWPTDVFMKEGTGVAKKITSASGYSGANTYCVIQDVTDNGNRIIYRRGWRKETMLCEKTIRGERVVSRILGHGGKFLQDGLYAMTDMSNNILMLNDTGVVAKFNIPGIAHFVDDSEYNFPMSDFSLHLNWLGVEEKNYVWSTKAITASISVTPSVTTTYYCKMTVNRKSCVDSVKISVNQLPTPVIKQNCMSLFTSKFTTYQWLMSGNPIPTATSSAFTPSASGNYQVMVTDSIGRLGISPVFIYSHQMVSDNLNNTNVEVTTDAQRGALVVHTSENLHAIVIDVGGTTRLEVDNATSIDIKDFPEGAYYLLLYNSDCVQVKKHKFVKNVH